MEDSRNTPGQRICDVQGLQGMMGSKICEDPHYSEATDTEYAYKHRSNRVSQCSDAGDCHLFKSKDKVDSENISDSDHCI